MSEKETFFDSVEERYYFEDATEFALYVKVNKPQNKVIYLSGNSYKDMFMSGWEYFEQKNYDKAIETLKKCLELNPVGISARFELAECYICTERFDLAKETLLGMKEYLVAATYKARFYRRLGFIAIEEKDYKTAYCCYKYSLNYENHPSVPQEIAYIKANSNSNFLFVSVKSVLKNKFIPLL